MFDRIAIHKFALLFACISAVSATVASPSLVVTQTTNTVRNGGMHIYTIRGLSRPTTMNLILDLPSSTGQYNQLVFSNPEDLVSRGSDMQLPVDYFYWEGDYRLHGTINGTSINPVTTKCVWQSIFSCGYIINSVVASRNTGIHFDRFTWDDWKDWIDLIAADGFNAIYEFDIVGWCGLNWDSDYMKANYDSSGYKSRSPLTDDSFRREVLRYAKEKGIRWGMDVNHGYWYGHILKDHPELLCTVKGRGWGTPRVTDSNKTMLKEITREMLRKYKPDFLWVDSEEPRIAGKSKDDCRNELTPENVVNRYKETVYDVIWDYNKANNSNVELLFMQVIDSNYVVQWHKALDADSQRDKRYLKWNNYSYADPYPGSRIKNCKKNGFKWNMGDNCCSIHDPITVKEINDNWSVLTSNKTNELWWYIPSANGFTDAIHSAIANNIGSNKPDILRHGYDPKNKIVWAEYLDKDRNIIAKASANLFVDGKRHSMNRSGKRYVSDIISSGDVYAINAYKDGYVYISAQGEVVPVRK